MPCPLSPATVDFSGRDGGAVRDVNMARTLDVVRYARIAHNLDDAVRNAEHVPDAPSQWRRADASQPALIRAGVW
jgi:hypothetical protein